MILQWSRKQFVLVGAIRVCHGLGGAGLLSPLWAFFSRGPEVCHPFLCA